MATTIASLRCEDRQSLEHQEIPAASSGKPYVYLEEMNAQGDELHMVTVSPRLGRTQ